MPELNLAPSTTQLRALVELARGGRVIMTDRAARWMEARATNRAGKIRLTTAKSLLRAGWIEPVGGGGFHFQISTTGRAVIAGIEPETVEAAGRSKVGLAPVDLLRALEAWHPPPRWTLATEVEVGLGEKRRIDVLAVSGIEVVAYELKVSREDFLRELGNPAKRAAAMEFASSFWFCAPVGIVDPLELPPRVGLLEVAWDRSARVVRIAERREAGRPSWPLVAAILRAAAKR